MSKIYDDFKSPGVYYRGKPFWSWNGKLEKDELDKIKSNELEYDKISKEIFSIKSSVSDVSISKGHVYNRDSTSRRDVISVIVSSGDSIDTGELEELREWLKVRMNTEAIEMRYHQIITE